MREHKLKILPIYFEAVLEENKTFEIRKDDRNFGIGDLLILQEFDGRNYTGREVIAEITYKLIGGNYGLEKEYCILSIRICNEAYL